MALETPPKLVQKLALQAVE